MFTDWEKIKQVLFPIKDYEDLCRRLKVSYSYPFIQAAYNFAIARLVEYTRLLLEGDARQRYTEYAASLVKTMTALQQQGVEDIMDLKTQTQTCTQLEKFAQESRIQAQEIAGVLKFLVYWIVPAEKYMSTLVRDDPVIEEALKILPEVGIRTNLQLLQAGISASGRKELAKASKLPETTIKALVNRADFSRLPWASKATISNIFGAGYGSLSQLAKADPQQLSEAFYKYGKTIGKNLKYGNEIESSHRIARILPVLLVED